MANFKEAAEKILDIEGGYVNDPDDYGRETNRGICKREYPEEDIKNLTKDRVLFLFKRDCWDKVSLDFVRNQQVAEEIFDLAAQLGWHRAAKKIQEIMNFLEMCSGSGIQLKIDGLIGPKTIGIINSYRYQLSIVKCLNGEQYEHYEKEATENPRQRKYIDGWLKRT